MRFFLVIFIFILALARGVCQEDSFYIDYSNPRKYVLKGIDVVGNVGIEKGLVVRYSGLIIGEEINIPGEQISKAILNLWKQRLFSDVQIEISKVYAESIELVIYLKSRPLLSQYSIQGVAKSEAEKIREKVSLARGEIVTDQLVKNASYQITKYYQDKGYYTPTIEIVEKPDTFFSQNSLQLIIKIAKNSRTRIREIDITGNDNVSDAKIKKLLKKTKQYQCWNIFRSSKYLEDLFEEDKQRVISYYQSLGFRDAEIVKDSLLINDSRSLKLVVEISEGRKYYFRNITWTGNTKYSTNMLNTLLGIARGDIYNSDILNERLFSSPNNTDVSTLYMDDGYLVFNIQPIEAKVEGDSIDLELRIFEGPQFVVNNVSVSGNTRIADHVILRELRTRPGEKFSKTDVVRSIRELANMQYFDPEKINVIPTPDPVNGTVDLEFKVEEKPSDQFQLQGGWGQGMFVGSMGFVFNNFSLRRVPRFKEWQPLPFGDGQRVSFRFQSNAIIYSSLNFSFTEPWFGGKKPNSLSFSAYRSVQNPYGIKKSDPKKQQIIISGLTVGLGKRLTFPDDYFTLYNSFSFLNYKLTNYKLDFTFENGTSNSLNFSHVLSRNSQNQPYYPSSGSVLSLTLTWTPPYSLFSDKDWSTATVQEKYKWMEYHKWKFDAGYYLSIIDKLVLSPRMQFGFLGCYNKKLGIIPFERFDVGGSGISGYHLDGRELISLRGYEDYSLTAKSSTESLATIFNKYTLELRYPISLNPAAMIYTLVFAEAGNSWLSFKDFDPFKIYRSAGVGVRIFMQMFGLIGFDWGYGFDEVPGNPGANKSNFHISLGEQF